MNKEEIIRRLKKISRHAVHTVGEPPFIMSLDDGIALDEAVRLLKEQEVVKPEREYSGGGTTWWNICGACRTAINPNDKYCHECGRAVEWNDSD